MRLTRVFLAVAILVCPTASAAQTSPNDSDACAPKKLQAFESRDWYEPSPASPTDPNVQFGLLHITEAFHFMPDQGRHKMLNAKAGYELPMVVFDSGDRGDLAPGCFGIGFWISPSFGFLLDYGSGQPPINSNDRVSGTVKFAYGLTNRDQLHIKFSFLHESTHLFDEAIGQALRNFPEKFKPIDVRYQAWEVGASWDRRFTNSLLTNRLAMMRTFGNQSFYSSDARGLGTVEPSNRNYELSYGLVYALMAQTGWRPYFAYSSELGAIYKYDKAKGQKDSLQISQHYLVGFHLFGKASDLVPDPYLMMSFGRNTAGQFRDQIHMHPLEMGILYRF